VRCSVIAVGTELLLGQIVDTNSSWIGERLAANGIDSHVQFKVGDNHRRIVSLLRGALDEADAVIMCGGLGPTHDDLTREAIAEVMGVELEMNDAVADVIREIFSSRGRRMADNNLRQAMVPRGATIMPHRRHRVEWRQGRVRGAGSAARDVRHDGASDPARSSPAHGRRERDREQGRAHLGRERERSQRTSGSVDRPTRTRRQSHARVSRQRMGGDQGTAHREVHRHAGEFVFGYDTDTMESVVLALLEARGWSLGLAESVTGGLVAGRITAVPGASRTFKGSIVSYASDVKFDVLSVPHGPVVSAEAAVAMADGARRVLGADVGLALTGVAGPSEQDGQPVGTLWVGLALPNHETTATLLRMPGTRDQMRQMSVISALDLLRRRII
jgi:nicotinamide-nucleotide amidase